MFFAACAKEGLHLQDARGLLEWIENLDVSTAKIRDVSRGENETPDARRGGQGHVIIVLGIRSHKSAPFRRNFAIDRDDAIAIGLNQRIQTLLGIGRLLRGPTRMRTGNALLDFLDRQGADA